MIYIAHRGLFNGPDASAENHPDQILLAVAMGFEVEVDIRIVDNKLYLGHDEPQYEIEPNWITDKPLWLHAKNIDVLDWFISKTTNLRYFWHQNDDFTLTNNGYIWTNPGQQLTTKSIMVMPEWQDPELNNVSPLLAGVCSDYVQTIRSKLTV